MRDKIAAEIEGGVPPHTLAPLMRQLREIDKEIRALDLRNEQDAHASNGPVSTDYDSSSI